MDAKITLSMCLVWIGLVVLCVVVQSGLKNIFKTKFIKSPSRIIDDFASFEDPH